MLGLLLRLLPEPLLPMEVRFPPFLFLHHTRQACHVFFAFSVGLGCHIEWRSMDMMQLEAMHQPYGELSIAHGKMLWSLTATSHHILHYAQNERRSGQGPSAAK